MLINKITIESSDSLTDLCAMGIKYGTDKCPYNQNPHLHKHPYTAVYDFIFGPLRYKQLNIAEIGILDNKSMLCWREYFPNATLHGYEWFDDKISNALQYNLENTSYYKMDVKDAVSIDDGLQFANCKFDVIVEDSTHEFDDQIRFAKIAVKYLKPGGILVIEDIFRHAKEENYQLALDDILKYFSSATFVMTEHNLKHSPGWDNDKLLILYRNDREYNNTLFSSRELRRDS